MNIKLSLTRQVLFFALGLIMLQHNAILAQNCLLSGPMLGPVDHHTARIWVQTKESCLITLHFKEANASTWRTQSAQTKKESYFTNVFTIDSLLPDNDYIYKLNERVYSFSTPKDWAFKAPPPAFDVAIGSCVYINDTPYDRPGKPYGQSPAIFQSIANDSPQVMLWLGDNTYLRPADFQSEYGVAYRYTHTRSTPELQDLLATCMHLAITDDHDFGPNDIGGFYPYRKWTKKVFEAFWPLPVHGAHHPNDLSSYFHLNGIDFYLLDNRTWREVPGDSAQCLGKSQIEWLIQNLKYSRSPFKMVAIGGQVLNTYPQYENLAVYKEERSYLLRRLEEEKIEGVIFLSGDRHMTELSRLALKDGIIVYDLTCSPLTSSPNTISVNEPNENRLEGTMVNVNNYALLHFSGDQKERKLTIEVKDREGITIWKKSIVKGQ